jgi:hypothetical protein
MAWTRRILVAGGLALIGVGLAGVLREPAVAAWPYFRFLAVSLVFADVFVMPVALVAGAIAARTLPGWLRVPVQAGLYASAAVTLVALPLLLGYGRDPALPSALPRDYPRGLLIVLAVVWMAVLSVALVRRAAGPRTGTRP